MEAIKINGKNYEISFVDTQDTIKNMVALQEGVFSNYIKFKVFDPSKKKITIELLPKSLKVAESDLSKTVLALSKEWNVPASDIALEWLEINKKVPVTAHSALELLPTLKKINSTDFWSETSINNAYAAYKKKKESSLKKLEELVQKEAEFRNDYAEYEPLDTTKFLQDSVVIEYQLSMNKDPYDTFNGIDLTNDVPFARLKTGDQVYYKLLKNLIPEDEWLEGDSTLTLKIYRGDSDDWGTVTINYTSTVEPYSAVMTLESKVGADKGADKTYQDILKNKIINIFTDTEITITSALEKGIKGVFAVPNITISRDVFLDLITNDPMIYHYVYVDETRELSSQKGVLYLYYAPGTTETQILTVFLSERVASRSDTFYNSKDLALFTPYLNVRVSRALTLDQVDRFKQAFAVILQVYKQKYNTIVKQYDALIPGFKLEHDQINTKVSHGDKKLTALQTQDPDLFIHDYPTKCEKKRQPVPILHADKKKWEKNGYQVMNYPKGSNNFFICNEENKFTFPGLMENKLKNSDAYPYLPCCYAVNQLTGKKLLNLYTKDLVKTNQSKTSNIVAKKAVGRNKLGYLPRNVHYILNKSAKPGQEFLRMGVQIGNNSFIEAVLLALDPDYEKLDDSDKQAYVQDFRTNLASSDMAPVIQSLYESNSTKIVKDISDPNVAFDSKLFTGLLEQYYNCKIIVFTRDENRPNGEYEIPRYTQGYLYKGLTQDTKLILIYKHSGIRSDYLPTPHYELIVRKYKKITTWYFTLNADDAAVVNNVYSYFLQTYSLYSIGMGRYRAIPVPIFQDAIGQIIDRYGKARGYLFNKGVYIITSPLPPANDLDIVGIPDDLPTWKNVQKFLDSHKLESHEQDIFDGKAIGVTVRVPNVSYVYIPFKPTNPLPYLLTSKKVGYTAPTKGDVLKTSLKNRKIADFLMQLLLYSFSLWYSDQLETEENIDLLAEIEKLPLAKRQLQSRKHLEQLTEQFIEEKMVTIPGYQYNINTLARGLSTNNNFFNDDQLVADSDKTFARLAYYLRFMINKTATFVKKYSERTHLDNYYTYADDFDARPDQLVFVGGLSISNWIDIQKLGISNQVHTVPHPQLEEPFFYAHWALNGGKPVIIQNVKNGTLGGACAVSHNYGMTGVNTGYNTDPIDTDKLNLATYFIQDGVLMRAGYGALDLWRYAPNFYAAILIP